MFIFIIIIIIISISIILKTVLRLAGAGQQAGVAGGAYDAKAAQRAGPRLLLLLLLLLLLF